ncbi:cyclin-dependent kinase-like 2 isoform X2 [Clupea harengus]|uniref:Cyclin-dependent kinase-like 2 n=1 Tax=Clupea harengus TaxID=7950 RepID=A0A6P8GRS7_CLUHA|nr:cyclin-dependent kinase-like 2 isoform X2 [Clupea harengus]
MEKYENLGLVGEGSYGMVLKCRNRETGKIVAVKKFLECEDDKSVKKIALREIKMLKQLRHENLVSLLEVCKRRRRWYLVFEFVDRNLLDELELHPSGLEQNRCRAYLYQILRALNYCHQHNIIHRDVKPENVLVSQQGVVKLCDFGFARTLALPGEAYTDYVATRWYRAPELLVGDPKYGKAVDIWAVGCVFMEMLTGEPLFPGDSDIDQLYHIIRCIGNLTPRHQEMFYRNPLFSGVSLPENPPHTNAHTLDLRFPSLTHSAVNLTKECLQIDPENRPCGVELQQHEYFTKDGFNVRFHQVLSYKEDLKETTTSPKGVRATKQETEERRAPIPKDLTPKTTPTAPTKPKEEETESRPLTSQGSASTSSRPIPPITHNPLTSGVGPVAGALRSFDKTKKHVNIFNRISQQSVSSHLAAQIPSERSLVCERSVGTVMKRRDTHTHRSDVRLPELKNTLLPELRGTEGKHKSNKEKDQKKDTKIPSIAPMDLHCSANM